MYLLCSWGAPPAFLIIQRWSHCFWKSESRSSLWIHYQGFLHLVWQWVTAEEAGALRCSSGSQSTSQNPAVVLATAEGSCPGLKSGMSLHLWKVYFTLSICLGHKYARNGTLRIGFPFSDFKTEGKISTVGSEQEVCTHLILGVGFKYSNIARISAGQSQVCT